MNGYDRTNGYDDVSGRATESFRFTYLHIVNAYVEAIQSCLKFVCLQGCCYQHVRLPRNREMRGYDWMR